MRSSTQKSGMSFGLFNVRQTSAFPLSAPIFGWIEPEASEPRSRHSLKSGPGTQRPSLTSPKRTLAPDSQQVSNLTLASTLSPGKSACRKLHALLTARISKEGEAADRTFALTWVLCGVAG